MVAKHRTQYSKDLPNKTITVTRHFAAPVETVWRAWTEQVVVELLKTL
ncbi:MAG: hypothetical protein JST68_19625 [Bacteroidetes bacterium]|nr:hypothetical protein [Bacteroidota bacterium]